MTAVSVAARSVRVDDWNQTLESGAYRATTLMRVA